MKKIFILFCRYITSPVVERLFLEQVKGFENVPQNSNFILAPNHLDGKDHWFIMAIFKKRLKDLRFLGAMDSLRILFLSGLLYYLTDTIKMDRRKVDREGILAKIIDVLKKNKSVVIYPEGNSNTGRNLLKGKTGAAELALRTGVPVVPAGIKINEKTRKRIVEMGKPLHFDEQRKIAKTIENDKEKYSALLRKTTDIIMKEISRLSGKPYPYGD